MPVPILLSVYTPIVSLPTEIMLVDIVSLSHQDKALILPTSSSLTWRDIQYLIVYTANPDLTAGPVSRNGAGLAVSRQYGFGVMDAEAMVTRARHWINVPPQIEDNATSVTM